MSKSEVIETGGVDDTTHVLATKLQCKAGTLPLKYLGLPLTDKKLTKTNYLPQIK
jgi:hypothetical protein